MTLPVVFTANGQAGYNLTKSLRFRSSASAYLNRTPASAGNKQIFTVSFWLKTAKSNFDYYLFEASTDGGNNERTVLAFNSGKLQFRHIDGGSAVLNLETTQVFRDPSAWYHIVLAVDTTQATSTNRVKFYVNGSQITAFGTASYPTQNLNTDWNGANAHSIGSSTFPDSYADMYLTEFYNIDGQQLTPSSFGETSTTTGVWIPKKFSGTYGTNGFYLPFTDTTSTSTLGTDFSGNSNTWTVNNISLTSGSTYDSMNDVPTLTSATTANYAVLNPVYKSASQPTISSGNLEVAPNAVTYQNAFSTIAITTGKWYCELLVTGTPNSANFIGISNQTQLNYLTQTANVIGATTGVGYSFFPANGDKYTNGTQTSYGTSVSSGDIVGIAVDLDNGKIWFSKNGTWQASGDPAAGTNAAFTGIASDLWSIGATVYSGGVTNFAFNFGQRPFAYTPPTGFVALNTFNLPTPTIGATASTTANKYFDINTYTGDGSQTASFTNSGSMQPDLVWSKIRSGTTQGIGVFDSVRGTTGQSLDTSATTVEGTWVGSNASDYGYVSAFNSNGFSVNDGAIATTGGYVNFSGRTYVAWQWRASNATAVTNTAGSITSTVSANTTAGFSIVTYTGTGSNATVGHGLGVAPSMIIARGRSAGTAGFNWRVYHGSLAATAYLEINTTSGQQTDATVWNSTAPTSSVFSLGSSGNVNGSTQTYVAYCFAPIAGYSAFGSYTGNGSTDGTFVFTGFRPRFLIVKRTNDIGSWIMTDSARSTYNVTGELFNANTSGAEFTTSDIKFDYLSNGFKLREVNGAINASGSTYIYMAFAESPFNYANAR
jgi:hypothetical protein